MRMANRPIIVKNTDKSSPPMGGKMLRRGLTTGEVIGSNKPSIGWWAPCGNQLRIACRINAKMNTLNSWCMTSSRPTISKETIDAAAGVITEPMAATGPRASTLKISSFRKRTAKHRIREAVSYFRILGMTRRSGTSTGLVKLTTVSYTHLTLPTKRIV